MRVTDPRPHLLWVNHFAAALDMGGGTRHFELGRELVRRGWRVTIAASDFHVHRREYLRRADATDKRTIVEEVDGVTFAWLWAAPYTRNDFRRVRNWLSFSMRVWRFGRRMDAPDVVIGSSPHLFAALAAQRVAQGLRRPFVLEVRDLWPESLAVSGGKPGMGYHALGALARFLYARARRIVVLAEGVREYLAKRGHSLDKLALVPNGVDVTPFTETPDPDARPFCLVYAGAHGPANGLDTVLEAAAMLRDNRAVQFVLMGDGTAKSALVERARTMQLTNVEFRESVAKTAIPQALGSNGAGLMVLRDLPLFAFGVSPNKLFDYWAARLPVICNVPGEVARLVQDAQGGIVTRDSSAAALAEAVQALVALSPAERQSLGEQGRAWVERERDRPLLAERLDQVLRPMLSSNRR